MCGGGGGGGLVVAPTGGSGCYCMEQLVCAQCLACIAFRVKGGPLVSSIHK